MTPTTTGGSRGGNLEIDRQITALGASRQERRLRLSIGSKDPKRLARVNTIIDKLLEDDRLETLRALQRGEITVSDLIEADRRGVAHKALGRVKLAARLWDLAREDGELEPGAVSRALARVKGSKTRSRYTTSFKKLQLVAGEQLGDDATVGDLELLDWEGLAARWNGSGADWMHLRRALSRFATLHLGDKFDPFARKLRQAIPTKKVRKRRPKISIARFREIVSHAPPHAAAAYWVLAISGMRVETEYLRCGKEHLDAASHTIDVPGTKTEGSENVLEVDPRWWPYIELGIPSRLRYGWLRKHWIRACVAAGVGSLVPTGKYFMRRVWSGKKYLGERREEQLHYVGPTLHDLRHCHGQWAIDAGVAESKVQASFRHETAGQTRDYVLRAATGDVSTALADAILGKPKKPRERRRA